MLELFKAKALGAFNVYADKVDYRSHLIGGKLVFKDSSIKYLPLSAEKNWLMTKI